MKTYIEELLTIFSGFYQTVFSFSTAHSLRQLFPQLTAHNNFFHSHSPTKQTLSVAICVKQADCFRERAEQACRVLKIFLQLCRRSFYKVISYLLSDILFFKGKGTRIVIPIY
jgi:hypothetical protein